MYSSPTSVHRHHLPHRTFWPRTLCINIPAQTAAHPFARCVPCSLTICASRPSENLQASWGPIRLCGQKVQSDRSLQRGSVATALLRVAPGTQSRGCMVTTVARLAAKPATWERGLRWGQKVGLEAGGGECHRRVGRIFGGWRDLCRRSADAILLECVCRGGCGSWTTLVMANSPRRDGGRGNEGG